MIRDALQMQCDRFLNAALVFFQRFTLSVTTRQSRDGRHVEAFREDLSPEQEALAEVPALLIEDYDEKN